MIARTLIVAPHPDDELIGCGGTLLRRKAEGHEVAWLIVTGMKLDMGWSPDRIQERSEEISRVAKLVGIDHVYKLDFPAARLDDFPKAELISAFAEVFKSFAPEEVLVPHRGDIHSDHRVAFEVAASCSKWFRCPSIRRVLAYETASETEMGIAQESTFRPNYFVDISDYLERKLEILSVYRSELADFPYPRSIQAIRALAQWRGANAGFHAAEAFELLRERH